MEMSVNIPLTSQWRLPGKGRSSYSGTRHLPEWTVDYQMEYSFNYDRAFLDVEKDYMEQGGDVMDGTARWWAAEALIKGQAACNTTAVPVCSQGIPANPP